MDTEIINRALIKIGEPVITSGEQTPYGGMMRILFEDFRKSLLSSYYWRFAIKRARLARLDEEPTSKVFNYAYALPNDYLLLKDFGESYKMPNMSDFIIAGDERYSIENGKLLTRYNDDAVVTYIADITDSKLFSPLFKEALIALIASEAVVRIKNSVELKQMFLSEFDGYLRQARINNEIVRDLESMPDNSWVACRDVFAGEY